MNRNKALYKSMFSLLYYTISEQQLTTCNANKPKNKDCWTLFTRWRHTYPQLTNGSTGPQESASPEQHLNQLSHFTGMLTQAARTRKITENVAKKTSASF